jgi:hypothetical protein
MNPMKLKTLAALGAAFLAVSPCVRAAPAAGAGVIYAQGFANNGEITQKMAGYGWTWFRNGQTAAQTADAKAISRTKGSAPMKNVNAPAPSGDNIAAGNWLLARNVPDIAAYAKPAAPIELAAYSGLSLSADILRKGVDNVSEFRFLIVVDSSPYVSDAVYKHDGAAGKWKTVTVSLDPDSKWVKLEGIDQTKKVKLAIAGPPAPLSSLGKSMTAFGFHSTVSKTSADQRGIDNFVVRGTIR